MFPLKTTLLAFAGRPAAALAVLALACTLAVPRAEAETVVPLATWGGANHVSVREFALSMERALKELGPHGLKFQHFPGGQLGQDKDMPMSVPMGQVKFAWISVNGWSGVAPDAKCWTPRPGSQCNSSIRSSRSRTAFTRC